MGYLSQIEAERGTGLKVDDIGTFRSSQYVPNQCLHRSARRKGFWRCVQIRRAGEFCLQVRTS